MPTTDPAKKQEQNWKRRYGITRRAYDRLLAYQGGMCASCGGQPGAEDGVFRIDHDHATGKVRGLLCLQCNTALGNAKDNPDTLARLKLYLETHAPRPALPAVAGTSPLGPEVIASGLPPSEEKAKDPRIPTPEVVAALKGHGLTLAQIATEFELDRPTVRALYTASQRSTRADNARDILLERALPHALQTIIQATQDGDAKTSVALVKGLGVLRDVVEQKEQAHGLGKPSFEEWRARVTGITSERVTVHLGGDPEPAALHPLLPDLDAHPCRTLPADGESAGAATGLAPRLDGRDQPEDARPEAGPSASPESVAGFRTV